MNSSPALLMISGWGASAAMWNSLAARLPELRVRSASWADCLDAAAIASLLPEGPVFVGGWSLGAMQALRIAADFPDRVRGVVMVAGSARFQADADYVGADPRGPRAMRVRLAKDAPRVMADFAETCLRPEMDESFREWYRAEAAMFPPETLAAGLNCLASLDLRSRLPEVLCPTLVIHGEEDAVIPVASARYVVWRLARASLVTWPGRGHALPVTAGDAVARAIEEFVHEHMAGR